MQNILPVNFPGLLHSCHAAAQRWWQVTLTDRGTGINTAQTDSHRQATHLRKVPERVAFPAPATGAPLCAASMDAQLAGETWAHGLAQLLVFRPTFQGIVYCSINFSSTCLPK